MIATAALAQMTQRGPRNMHWGDNGRPWGMVIVMIVLAALLVGGIVWAFVYASRSSRRATGATASPAAVPAGGTIPSAGPSPREILDLRYAKGEIDTADYEERRAKLD